MAGIEYHGDSERFAKNWRTRKESRYLHWRKGDPQNQIQLAFRKHWLTFSRILEDHSLSPGRCLEVGCGRGSLSAYFADSGWNASLLDISSDVIELAKEAFSEAKLDGNFLVGDCLNIPAQESSFDCVFSIGLLEHFSDPLNVAKEQVRVLKEGGVLFAYIVPEKKAKVQEQYQWFNNILRLEHPLEADARKEDVYRSSYGLDYYLEVFRDAGLDVLGSSGIYSMPMISNSIEFPFTLLKPESELMLTSYLQDFLSRRSDKVLSDSWLCEEDYGNAILVWGTK